MMILLHFYSQQFPSAWDYYSLVQAGIADYPTGPAYYRWHYPICSVPLSYVQYVPVNFLYIRGAFAPTPASLLHRNGLLRH